MQQMVFRFFALLPFLFVLATPAQSQSSARAPKLDIPIKCTLGQDCFIQHYIDADPSKASADHTCGSLTYDNHRGTDFRIKTVADMALGVPVIAAADGRVVNLRNGVQDQYYSDYSREKKKKIFQIGLGNVVIVNHGNGWDTFYAHLKKGSLTVKKGQNVKKGDILGYVGMSGLTDFPHMHFELRHNNKRVDPFSGLGVGGQCGKIEKTYWSDMAQRDLSYRQTAFITTGFSETRPKGRKDLESGKKGQSELHPAAPTLFFWSYYIGSRKGDIAHFKMMGPEGKTLTEKSFDPAPRHQIAKNFFIGTKRPSGGWKPGLYRGVVTISRDGKQLKNEAVITVR